MAKTGKIHLATLINKTGVGCYSLGKWGQQERGNGVRAGDKLFKKFPREGVWKLGTERRHFVHSSTRDYILV